MRRKVYRHKITRAGQVSIPAEIRHRWDTTTVLTRRHGGDPDEVLAQVESLIDHAAHAVPATTEHAPRAGELRARHWRRNQRVSLADCFVLATADPGDRIATLDGRLAAVAHEEGYEVVSLG